MPPRASSKRGSVPPESDGESAGAGRVTRGRRAASNEPLVSYNPSQSQPKGRAAKGQTISSAMVDPELSTVHEQAEQLHSSQPHIEDGSQSQWIVPLPEDIIVEIPLLHSNANTILNILSKLVEKNALDHALVDPNSQLRRRLGLSDRLQHQIQLLGSESPYVNVHSIESVLFAGHDDALDMSRQRDIKLDDILYKVNLATYVFLLISWYTHGPDDVLIDGSLTHINDWFPGHFLMGFYDKVDLAEQTTLELRSGYSKLEDITANYAVELRTQYAIARMRQAALDDTDEDPAILLREIFYTSDGQTVKTREALEQQALRGWNTSGFEAYAEKVKQRIDAIDALLPDEGDDDFQKQSQESPYHEELSRKYDWGQFCILSLHWIKARLDELNLELQRKGGVETIVEAVERLTSGDLDVTLPQVQDPAFSQMQHIAALASQPRYQTPDQISPARGLTQGQSQSASMFQTPNAYPARPLYTSNAAAIAAANQREMEAFGDTLGDTLQAALRQDQQPRSMLDSQANGSKITFTDSIPAGAQITASTARKRKRPQNNDVELSQDVGYSYERRPRIEPPQSTLDPNAFVNVESSDGVIELGETLEGSLPPSQLDDRDAQIIHYYQNIRSTGKSIADKRKAESKVEDDRKVQERKRWTSEEVATLIRYIEELGTSWAQIQKADASQGHVLANRDQVALKDKARNLKFEFLKAGADAPKNFESVSLSKSMKVKLEAWKLNRS